MLAIALEETMQLSISGVRDEEEVRISKLV